MYKSNLIMLSFTEENYLKAIYKVSERAENNVSTNAISKEMQTSAASVTDMLKRLSEKKLIHYERYKGVSMTQEGQRIAKYLIRKHRLWEVFLVEKLEFTWDEVHDIAEQLEHIKSDSLIERLDQFLGRPKFDPHGDPIPDADGNIAFRKQLPLSELAINQIGVIVGVQEHTTPFLQYLDKLSLTLGTEVEIIEKFEFDDSIKLIVNHTHELILSGKVSKNIFVQ